MTKIYLILLLVLLFFSHIDVRAQEVKWSTPKSNIPLIDTYMSKYTLWTPQEGAVVLFEPSFSTILNRIDSLDVRSRRLLVSMKLRLPEETIGVCELVDLDVAFYFEGEKDNHLVDRVKEAFNDIHVECVYAPYPVYSNMRFIHFTVPFLRQGTD